MTVTLWTDASGSSLFLLHQFSSFFFSFFSICTFPLIIFCLIYVSVCVYVPCLYGARPQFSPFVCPSVCPSDRPSVCLSLSPSIPLFVRGSHLLEFFVYCLLPHPSCLTSSLSCLRRSSSSFCLGVQG